MNAADRKEKRGTKARRGSLPEVSGARKPPAAKRGAAISPASRPEAQGPDAGLKASGAPAGAKRKASISPQAFRSEAQGPDAGVEVPGAAGVGGWWVYLVRCRDGSLYAGCTNDLTRRLLAHNAGRGAAYTRSRGPVELAWWEPQPDRSAALRREWAIKQLTRRQKLALVSAGTLDAGSP